MMAFALGMCTMAFLLLLALCVGAVLEEWRSHLHAPTQNAAVGPMMQARMIRAWDGRSPLLLTFVALEHGRAIQIGRN